VKNTFGNIEKLKSSKKITALFDSGKSHKNFPLKMLFMEQDEGLPSQVAFSVPKRNFPKAISRNRIKRQMREAYRLHKSLVKSNNGKTFALLFLYISKDKETYADIENSMRSLMEKLQK